MEPYDPIKNTAEEISSPPFHEIEAFGLKVKSDDGMNTILIVIFLVAIGYVFKVAIDNLFCYGLEWFKHHRINK